LHLNRRFRQEKTGKRLMVVMSSVLEKAISAARMLHGRQITPTPIYLVNEMGKSAPIAA